jgi:hypothetical protein
VQVDPGVGAEHGAGGDAEGEGIADLAGSPGDRNVHNFHGACFRLRQKSREF